LEAYLRDDKKLIGKVTTKEEGALVLEPAEGGPSVPIAMSEVKTLSPRPPDSWEISGNVTAGASKETGNTDTEKLYCKVYMRDRLSMSNSTSFQKMDIWIGSTKTRPISERIEVPYGTGVNCTLRFSARPSLVLLVATGRVNPNPSA